MTAVKDLLFELGCEELPSKTLLRLSDALLQNIENGLKNAGLDFTGSLSYATPRRLAVVIENLATSQNDVEQERRGPAVAAAFTADGEPTKACAGFAKSCATSVDKLDRIKTDKGEWLAFKKTLKGKNSEDLIPEIIKKSLDALPIAKRMRWGASATEFVRPVHWVVLLFGDQVIAHDILGITPGETTIGHRFHANLSIPIESPRSYSETLYQKGKVIADFEQRKTKIKESAKLAAEEVKGTAHIEEDLLEEVTALNEWPVPVTGNFDSRFLSLPAEVLITTMQTNQKYFPVKDAAGQLLPHFITFSNIESSHQQSIQSGNERVIKPRLTDAEFFWKQDRKLSLENRIEKLAHIVFQEKLGTLADKSARVKALSVYIAQQLGENVELAERAAMLAKTDLLTEMVGEFASLQGIMGRYYALADQEPTDVAAALEEQYFPKQSGGPTPQTKTGQILAIAEKIDTLCGIFSIGLIPTGDKDPYALRRAALGILRIIIENKLNLDLHHCIDFSLNQFQHQFEKTESKERITAFIYDRLKGYFLDHGFAADEFESVKSIQPTMPLDFQQRLLAVKSFRTLPEASSLAAANKRISNILRKSPIAATESYDKLVESEELELLRSAKKVANAIHPLLQQNDYTSVLSNLAQLRNDVDTFFDHIMVMCDDVELRNQRLALLTFISSLFLQIADISKLQS